MQEKTDKAALRRALLANRQQLPEEVRKLLDARIGAQVLAWWRMQRPQRIGVYWPMRAEPDLREIYTTLCREGVQLALPVVIEKDVALDFAAWKPGAALVRDCHGVPVPPTGAARLKPDALLIPCVGFNAKRQRLGYGGGYYDRTLAGTPRPETIGVAYDIARCDFEGGEHDIALDRIITESGLLP